MGASIWIKRAEGEEQEMHGLTATEALQIIEAVDWPAELRAANAYPEPELWEHLPDAGIVSESGHILKPWLWSDGSFSASLACPKRHSYVGFANRDEIEEHRATDIPRRLLPEIMEAFFQERYDEVAALIDKYGDEETAP